MAAACDFAGAGCDYFSGLTCNAQSSTCVTAQVVGPGNACGIVASQAVYCIDGLCLRGACAGNAPLGDPCDINLGPQCVGAARCVVSGDGGTRGTCQLSGATACP
jgi:hypothetical protein